MAIVGAKHVSMRDRRTLLVRAGGSRACDKINRLQSEEPWVYKVFVPDIRTEITD